MDRNDILQSNNGHPEAYSEYPIFCYLVRQHTNLDLGAYKRNQMERRVRAMADRAHCTSLHEYWRKLSRDQEELRQFMDRLTINVSEFFRNAEKFEELRTTILPELLRKDLPLMVWSAGCACGAEAYSLKILLHRMSPGVRHQILATDIDTESLAQAKSGIYREDDVRNVSENYRRRYFSNVETGYLIKPYLRSGLEFRYHDLLKDPFPRHVDLILCRNVVIYFSEATKRDLYKRLYESLNPGGYLLLGSTERIFNAESLGFVSAPYPFFYKKSC